MFGWFKRLIARFKKPSFLCGICGFDGNTQEELDAHEKECHPITSAALKTLRDGHRRHVLIDGANRSYIERPAQTFGELEAGEGMGLPNPPSPGETLGLEQSSYPGPLTPPKNGDLADISLGEQPGQQASEGEDESEK